MSQVSSIGRVAPALRINNRLLTIAISALLVLGSAAASHAAIVKPTAALATSSPGGFQYQSIDRTIDGTGLSSALNTGDAVPLTGFWPTHSINQSTLWVGDNTTFPGDIPTQQTWTVTYTLGATYTLSGFHLWNENEAEAGRSSKDFTASYSTDNLSYTPIIVSPAPFLPGTGLASYQGQDYTFNNYISASYVRFTITSNYGGQYVGLSEIRFVPEPMSVSLLGLGVVGLLRRRRAGF